MASSSPVVVVTAAAGWLTLSLVAVFIFVVDGAPILTITPPSLSLQFYGTQASPIIQSVILSNTGDASLVVNSVSMPSPQQWMGINANAWSTPRTIVAGGTATLLVNVTNFALTTNTYTHQLSINSSTSPGALIMYTVTLQVMAAFEVALTSTATPVPNIWTANTPQQHTLVEGGRVYFWYRARSNHTHALTVTATSSSTSELQAQPASRVHAAQSWSRTGGAKFDITSMIADYVYRGTRRVNITLSATSTSVGYTLPSFAVLQVTITDQQTVSIVFGSLVYKLTEGTSGTLQVQLGAEPTAPVVFTWPTTDTYFLQMAPATMTLDASNWNATTNNVLVTAVDNAIVTGNITRTLTLLSTASLTSTDTLFAALASTQSSVLRVVIADNDVEYASLSPKLSPAQGAIYLTIQYPTSVSFFRPTTTSSSSSSSSSSSVVVAASMPSLQCRFNDGLNVRVVTAVLVNERAVQCYVPTCTPGPVGISECVTPTSVHVIVNGQVSVNAGADNRIAYYDTPTIHRLIPEDGDVTESIPLTVVGTNYVDSPTAVCRIGPVITAARLSSYTALNKVVWNAYICDTPIRRDLIGRKGSVVQEVAVSVDGQRFYTSGKALFSYVDMALERTNAYWLWFWVIFNLVLLFVISLFIYDCCIRVTRIRRKKTDAQRVGEFGGPSYLLREAIDWALKAMHMHADDIRFQVAVCEVLQACLINGETKRRMVIPLRLRKDGSGDGGGADNDDLELGAPGGMPSSFKGHGSGGSGGGGGGGGGQTIGNALLKRLRGHNDEDEYVVVYGIELIIDVLTRFCLPEFTPTQPLPFKGAVGLSFRGGGGRGGGGGGGDSNDSDDEDDEVEVLVDEEADFRMFNRNMSISQAPPSPTATVTGTGPAHRLSSFGGSGGAGMTEMELMKMMTRFSTDATLLNQTFHSRQRRPIDTNDRIALAVLICDIITACASDSAEFRSKVGALSGAPLLVRLLQTYPNTVEIVEHSLMALASLLIYSDKAKAEYLNVGDISRQCIAMYPDNAGVQKWGHLLISFLQRPSAAIGS